MRASVIIIHPSIVTILSFVLLDLGYTWHFTNDIAVGRSLILSRICHGYSITAVFKLTLWMDHGICDRHGTTWEVNGAKVNE